MEGGQEDKGNLRDFLEEAELIQYHELFRDILKVTKLSQLKFVLIEDLAHIGLSKPEQRRYKKIYSKYFPNPYIAKIKKLITSNKRNDLYNQGPNSLPIEFDRPFPDNSLKGPTKHIIPVEDITINKELGMGQFGVVQLGTWNTGTQRLQVAIKCLGHERMTSNSTEFLKEAAVMHSIEHPNIVRLYGVVLHLDSLMLVTELAPLRSLLECLREVSLRPNFPVPSLCEFAEQICGGMTYLENKRLIHRDLAARNILVFSKDRVKISDFGLSRALGVGKDYYQTNYNVNLKLPVAWCAPECILYLKFTSGSDMWAFGVCLWEMFTYGFQPWAAFSGQQILEAIDAPNYHRLERPECCPELYYTTMLECWSHDPNSRPKFKDLEIKLREIRPEQVVTTEDYKKSEDARSKNYLEYKSGQLLTVLGKETMTKCHLWYGVLPGGTCGVFDPNKTKPHIKTVKSSHSPQSTSSRSSVRLPSSMRPTILRSDVKRHTYTGKRTLQRSMISSPQGDVKHTGHVGLDGAYFGDISFLDPAGCPPKQIVTPYKPSEDLEQQPLINPNSPSHLTGGDASSTPPYPLLSQEPTPEHVPNRTEAASTSKSSSKKHHLRSEATTSLLSKFQMRSAALGRYHSEEAGPSAGKDDEIHEYHEISDTDTEPTAADNPRLDNFLVPESPSTPKNCADFSQSLMDEMEAIFRSQSGRGDATPTTPQPRSSEIDSAFKSHTLGKHEKKKVLNTGTMKPMSAHDQKTLETAVALANKLTTRSMNDLGTENHKPAPSPSEKHHKFHFKFPTLHMHSASNQNSTDSDKESHGEKKEPRKNFCDETPSALAVQESLSKEGKAAYHSLIEEPVLSSSLIPALQGVAGGAECAGLSSHPRYDPNFTAKQAAARAAEESRRLREHLEQVEFRPLSERTPLNSEDITPVQNELPLPPRTTKPKLVNKARHIRKHPLVLSPSHKLIEFKIPSHPLAAKTDPVIYQNLQPNCMKDKKEKQYQNLEAKGVDVHDGCSSETAKDTNPFKSTSSVNPFIDTVDSAAKEEQPGTSAQYFEEGSLVKDSDHVSVEDLLEFADHKPRGRQRGVESDEVRVMKKILKNQVTLEQCVEALEVCDWEVHHAIKILSVLIETTSDVTLDECVRALIAANDDVVRAARGLELAGNSN